MANAFRLYLRFLRISLSAQMEYRASFLMQALGNFVVTCGEFAALYALFGRFGRVEGWSLEEVALLYGLVSASFAIAEAAAYGFDSFGSMLKQGEFDTLLLRPRSLTLQLMGQHLALKNIGRFAQGVMVFGWAVAHLPVEWNAGNVAITTAAMLGAICLFFSLVVVQASIAFWTIESIEVMNAVTYGGVETAQFPLTIYPAWLRNFFVFIVPLGCVTYLPMLAVLGRPAPAGLPQFVLWIAPLASLIFAAAAFGFFRVGVRHYTSAGS
jgi:ABC-2 type transport system permease protein